MRPGIGRILCLLATSASGWADENLSTPRVALIATEELKKLKIEN